MGVKTEKRQATTPILPRRSGRFFPQPRLSAAANGRDTNKKEVADIIENRNEKDSECIVNGI